MTEDLPSFDPEIPATFPKPPKKPRRKPTKKRKARAPVVTHPQPKKKRGKKRAGISRKPDRRTKAFRQARVAPPKILRGRMRDTDAIAELKTDVLPAAAAGQAQAVLAVLAVLAGYPSDVRRVILARAGMLA
jgi:hypothetical protein